ncbi:hypothetical protein R3P38DRAFT_2857037, partial [Favolaschia claudopus]
LTSSSPKALTCLYRRCLSLAPTVHLLRIMHCKAFFALVLSCVILSVAAAPIPEPQLSRDVAADVVEVARSPEPAPEPGCRMYACI